jgi:hypothetical protein
MIQLLPLESPTRDENRSQGATPNLVPFLPMQGHSVAYRWTPERNSQAVAIKAESLADTKVDLRSGKTLV